MWGSGSIEAGPPTIISVQTNSCIHALMYLQFILSAVNTFNINTNETVEKEFFNGHKFI